MPRITLHVIHRSLQQESSIGAKAIETAHIHMSLYLPPWLNDSAIGIAVQIVAILCIAWALRRLARKLFRLIARRKVLPAQFPEGGRRLVSTFISVVALLLILERLGVSAHVLWGAVTGFLAVAAIAFFAAWSVLSNIFCAVLVLATRPFRLGDYIEVLETGDKPGLRGKVTAINFIFTTLTESEPAESPWVLQVPNTLFFQRVVRRSSRPITT
ncbi:MAG TPA: mechanosensitive ion channel family protein [Steroidobacteraceae bacterium]|nr:mechanosensitive ion channel family protein [Steroidobacteraceae bacterium]